jgi:hypothetical protein
MGVHRFDGSLSKVVEVHALTVGQNNELPAHDVLLPLVRAAGPDANCRVSSRALPTRKTNPNSTVDLAFSYSMTQSRLVPVSSASRPWLHPSSRQRSDVSCAPGRHTTEHGEMSAISGMGSAVKQPDQAEEKQR